MLQETQKLAKAVAANVEQTNEKLAPKIKEAYDDFVKQAEQVQKKLHEAATKQWNVNRLISDPQYTISYSL